MFWSDSSSRGYTNYSDLIQKNNSNKQLKIKKAKSKTNFLFGLTSGSTSDPKVSIWSQQIKIDGVSCKKNV